MANCNAARSAGGAGPYLIHLAGTGNDTAERVGVRAIESEHLICAGIAQRICRVAAEGHVAEDRAAAGATQHDAAEDRRAAGVAGIAGDHERAGAVFVERADERTPVEICSVGQVGGVRPRVVVGEPEFQHGCRVK